MFGATGSLPQQFVRYLFVGGLAFAVDFGLLYLLTDYVYLANTQQLMIQSAIYVPFVALAAIDAWHYRRREASRR